MNDYIIDGLGNIAWITRVFTEEQVKSIMNVSKALANAYNCNIGSVHIHGMIDGDMVTSSFNGGFMFMQNDYEFSYNPIPVSKLRMREITVDSKYSGFGEYGNISLGITTFIIPTNTGKYIIFNKTEQLGSITNMMRRDSIIIELASSDNPITVKIVD